MRTITLYEAFDGKQFDAPEACRAHEAQHVEMRLVGLTIDQVRAALSRDDRELAEALEEIGKRCANARREAGDLKRKPKSQAEVVAQEIAGAAGLPEAADEEAPQSERDPKALEERGRAAFRDGIGGIIPDDLKDDPKAGQIWLSGWDYESAASYQRRSA